MQVSARRLTWLAYATAWYKSLEAIFPPFSTNTSLSPFSSSPARTLYLDSNKIRLSPVVRSPSTWICLSIVFRGQVNRDLVLSHSDPYPFHSTAPMYPSNNLGMFVANPLNGIRFAADRS